MAEEEKRRFYIYVPSSRAFLVMCATHEKPGQEVTNWRELRDEARKAVEPALRKRWYEYRQREMMMVIQALESDASLDAVMGFVCSPSMEYPCPPELAAKAIVEE
jgi:hypothetical protein